MAIFKYAAKSNVVMVRGGARNIMDGSKATSVPHFLRAFASIRDDVDRHNSGSTDREITELANYVKNTPGTALVLYCADYYLYDHCDMLVMNHDGVGYAYKAGRDDPADKPVTFSFSSHFNGFNEFKPYSAVQEFARKSDCCLTLSSDEVESDYSFAALVIDKSGNLFLTDKADGSHNNHRFDSEVEIAVIAPSSVVSERSTPNTNTGEVKMTTIKTTATAIVAANKNAAVNAAKLEAGSIVLKKVSTIAASKAPFMVRGYVDTAVGRVVIANLLNFAVSQYAPGNRKAVIAADAAMQAAMLELVQSFNIGEMLDEVLKGVNLSSLIESENVTE